MMAERLLTLMIDWQVGKRKFGRQLQLADPKGKQAKGDLKIWGFENLMMAERLLTLMID